VKLEYIGVNECKDASHIKFLAEHRFILHQERHVLPNLAVRIKYRLKTVRPCACSLWDALSAFSCKIRIILSKRIGFHQRLVILEGSSEGKCNYSHYL
jgi:hypothetical protein